MNKGPEKVLVFFYEKSSSLDAKGFARFFLYGVFHRPSVPSISGSFCPKWSFHILILPPALTFPRDTRQKKHRLLLLQILSNGEIILDLRENIFSDFLFEEVVQKH